MRCIICLAEKPPSPEHVIPRALGGSFVIHRVCRDCNNLLGAIADQGLIEHNAAVERRVALQIASNRGAIPDPVGDAVRRPIATGIPNVRVRLSPEAGGYRASVEKHAEVRLVEQPDGTTHIEINLVVDAGDERNAEIYLRSALRKAGIKDEARLTEICAQALPMLELRHGPTTVGVPVRKNDGGHHLGITKIAYEMAHYWLGDTWLDDPIAIAMRRGLRGDKNASGRFMIGDGKAMDRPRVATDTATPFEELPLGYDPTRTNIMTLYPIGELLYVCVWLLDAFSAMFLVTDNAKAYQRPRLDSVAMDVGLRKAEEFMTIMPVLPASDSGDLS